MVPSIEIISIEVTDKCAKACSFCYSHSIPGGRKSWQAREIIDFVSDCRLHTLRAVSFGGGEPLQYPAIFEVLEGLRGKLFRSMTTNGLLLEQNINALVAAAPDKVHVSIHFPDALDEVHSVIESVKMLADRGIKSGINFLVRRSQLPEAAEAAEIVRSAGIENERIVYLPMRGHDTPTPAQMAQVAGNKPFQSMSCLSACKASPRFCSISVEKEVGWCSYTSERAELPSLTFQGLTQALDNLGLAFCGGTQ